VAGIVSSGKSDEYLLSDNSETIFFGLYFFCDIMVTVVCSNFYHFGKQVRVNSEKIFKGIVLMKLMNISSEAKKGTYLREHKST